MGGFSKMSLVKGVNWLKNLVWLIDVQMHFMANLKNPGHYWILLIVPRNKLIWNWQNLVLLSMTWLQSTQRLHLISANLKEQFTPCMLKLMICLPKLRVVKKKPMVDAARLADELRAEQEHSNSQEKAKRTLESQITELEQRLTEANEVASKGGRNAMAKLESRIRELEIELGNVQCRTSENYKGFQKADRRVKELQFQQDEDHKNADRMSDLANKLQQKIKTYKKQIEEAEEIAALNLAKYRKAQQGLEESEERAKLAATAMSMGRGASVM